MQYIGVTGVMITGKSVERFDLARRAVASWQAQYYPAECFRELLVINDHPTIAIVPQLMDATGVRELRVPPQKTLGALRNIAFEHVTTPYLIQWDDDDYSPPERLCWQVAHTPRGRASLLRYEVHCYVRSSDAFVNDGHSIRCGGFPGTMLWPRNHCRFPEIPKREDTEFVLQLRQVCGIEVLDNDPTLYLRCYTGHNTWSAKHVMQRKHGARPLTPYEQLRVQDMLTLSAPYLPEVDDA